jgi:hypothetical protein
MHRQVKSRNIWPWKPAVPIFYQKAVFKMMPRLIYTIFWPKTMQMYRVEHGDFDRMKKILQSPYQILLTWPSVNHRIYRTICSVNLHLYRIEYSEFKKIKKFSKVHIRYPLWPSVNHRIYMNFIFDESGAVTPWWRHFLKF